MNNGQVAQASSTQDVYFLPQSRFVADFIGETNFFEGRIVAIDTDSCALQRQQMSVVIPKREHFAVDQQIAIGVRSERIQLSRHSETLKHLDNRYEGHVKEVIFQGDRTAYTIQIGSDTVKVVESNLMDSVTYHKMIRSRLAGRHLMSLC